MVRSAKHEVARCSKSGHLTIFYALTTVIRLPFEASGQVGWVVLGLYIGIVFTFSLIYHFLIICFYLL